LVHLLKPVFVLAFFFSFFSLVLAQPQLEMIFIGYGSTYSEVRIAFKNTGNTTLSDITLYIDGNASKTIKGVSVPGTTFEDIIYLSPGKHLIEARTPEGAYAKLEVTAAEGSVPQPTMPVEKPKPQPYWLWIVLGFAILLVLLVWLLIEGRK